MRHEGRGAILLCFKIGRFLDNSHYDLHNTVGMFSDLPANQWDKIIFSINSQPEMVQRLLSALTVKEQGFIRRTVQMVARSIESIEFGYERDTPTMSHVLRIELYLLPEGQENHTPQLASTTAPSEPPRRRMHHRKTTS